MIADHYRLVEQIGSGGTGVVWRAVDERLQRSVAIKQIHIKPSLPPAERDVLRQRASREARNAARFQHPNAIVVFDITEHGGDPCLVMEYMKSRSLAQVLSSQGPLPLPQVARIGEQVAAALIAAHQAGIVHRDVKPGNVLLDDHGTVKITDFGISRATGDVTLTETGLICGTAAYLAPEVARGADPTPAADVFALGATLFHALEGEPPFGSGNPLKVLYAAANGQVSEPQNAGPATDFLLDLLEADPRLRPTMQEAREQLSRFAGFPGASAEHVGFVPAREAFDRNGHDRNGHSGGAAVSTMESPAPGRTRGSAPAPAPRRRPEPRDDDGYDTRPPRRAANHPPTSTQPVAGGPGSGGGGVRRAVLIGGIAGAAVVGGVLWFSSSDSGDNSAAQADTSVSSTAPRATGTTAATSPALGTTPSSGQVEWVQAGQLLEQFYMDPAGSWSLLTPAAQQVYGSQAEFQEYWSTRTVESFNRIEAFKGNNPDGSVDMRVNNLSYGGQTGNPTVRVVLSGGRLLIDSDTR
ncbi:serine/threonine-protein kinase [Nocardia carnea]|uniref:serine/threonine-protein kinase n=1 Tax=Nocardia carnea TaxID=37328 RepID=UPI002458E189|nr:serine/threonine-protein kinase [Nocardia carnea]